MNILYFDLESSPILGYAWQMWEANILAIEKETGLLSFAYKINDGPTRVLSVREYTEKEMVKLLHQLFNESDVIVAQNGDKFDIKLANRLFIKYNLPPPSPYKSVDTLKIAKKYFRFDSNKLDNLAYTLLGERKLPTDMALWLDCMKGDVSALRKMERYCKQDVDLLYKVYHKLRAWHTGHPNSNVYNETTHKCPVCSGNTQKRGFMYTRVGKYQRHQCTSCGSWSKGIKVNVEKVIS